MSRTGSRWIVWLVVLGTIGAHPLLASDDGIRLHPNNQILTTNGNRMVVAAADPSVVACHLKMVGTKIRVQSGEHQGWYLTADDRGEVYLSEKPEIGSEWRVLINSGFHGNYLYNQGLGDGDRRLSIEKKCSNFTDKDGKKRTGQELRLLERGSNTKAAEFSGFLFR